MKRATLLIITALAFACSSAPPPPPEPAPAPAPAAPAQETAIGAVRVTAAGLNVRRDPSTTAEVLTTAKKGQRLTLLSTTESWAKVRLDDGTTGWVSRQYVAREGEKQASAGSKSRRSGSCPPDSDYAFAKMPTPSFSDSSQHGLVTVEATVTAAGDVTSAKVISNTTGDEALGFLTVREIKSAKFIAPVRNCAAKPFIFTYKRSF